MIRSHRETLLKRHSLLLLRSLLLLALSAAAVFAFDEMSASADGRGAVTRDGDSFAVDRAEVSLTPDGDYIISFHGNQVWRFRGDWRQIDDLHVDLTVKESPAGAVDGRGFLDLRNGRFQEIELHAGNLKAEFAATGDYQDFTSTGGERDGSVRANRGRNRTARAQPSERVGGIRSPQPPARREKVEAARAGSLQRGAGSRSARPEAPSPPEVDPPVQTVRGEGRFDRSREEAQSLHGMEVFLYENGPAHLKMFGDGFQGILQGSWSAGERLANGGRRYELTLVNGPGGRLQGSGHVLTDAQGRPRHVEANGRSNQNGRSFRLLFDSRF